MHSATEGVIQRYIDYEIILSQCEMLAMRKRKMHEECECRRVFE